MLRVVTGISIVMALFVGATPRPAGAQEAQRPAAPNPAPTELLGQTLSANPSGYPAGLLNLGWPGATGEPVTDTWVWLEALAPRLGIEDARAELRVVDVTVAGSETIVRLEQRVGDLPVFRGVVVVVIDGEGRLEDLMNAYVAFEQPLSERLLEAPRLTAREAAAQALADDAQSPVERRAFAVPENVDPERFTRLVYVAPVGTAPRLAWEVHPPGVHLAQNWRVFYDAQTGERIWSFNDLRFENEGRVYDPSPGADGDEEPVVRTLRDRDDEDGFLTGPLVEARNCVEDGETVISVAGFEAELCSEIQVAQADESGDFLYEPDTRAEDDLFAEVQMYYHVSEIYAHFQAIGLDTVDEVPLPATVNFLIPGIITGSADNLVPFDNAFFFPAGDIIPGVFSRDFDSIVFGQGTNVDFSYDGDVIYHEFGHAVFNAVATPGQFTIDRWGLSSAPGALNEGMADVFAGSFTDDPEIGEYVGPRIVSGTSEARNIRDIGTSASCPGTIVGQVHADSVHFSSALWDIRAAFVDELSGDVEAFDAAMLASVRRLTPIITFDQAADVFEDELIDLNPNLATAIDDAFDGHGARGCERFILLGGTFRVHAGQALYGRDALGLEPWVPGFVQYKVTVAEAEPAHNTITLTFAYGGGGGFGGGQPAFPRFVVAYDEPVELNTFGSQITGNWIDEITTSEEGGQRVGRYQVEGALTLGDYYFLPVGTVGSQGAMAQVRATTSYLDPPVEPEPTPDVDEADAGAGDDIGLDLSPDAGGTADVDASGPNGQTDGGDGCGCSAANSAPAEIALWLLVLGAVGIPRRRRRLN